MLSDFFVGFSMNERVKSTPFLSGFGHKLQESKKDIATFGLLFIGSYVVSSALFYFVEGSTPKFILTMLLLVTGYIHTLVLQGSLSGFSRLQRILYTLLLVVLLFLPWCVFYLLSVHYSFSIFLSAAFAFLLPFTIKEMWHFFTRLSISEPIIWHYTQDLPLSKATTFLNSMPVKFRLEHNKQEENISFRAPVKMKLGLLFYHVVQERNSNNSRQLEIDSSAGWVFYTVGFGGIVKYLDPEAGLMENGIRQNKRVVAKQLPVLKTLPAKISTNK